MGGSDSLGGLGSSGRPGGDDWRKRAVVGAGVFMAGLLGGLAFLWLYRWVVAGVFRHL